jgi:hypothetical protein
MRRLRTPVAHLTPLAVALALLMVEPRAHAESCPPAGEAALPETVTLRDLGERLRGRVDACAGDARRADGERFYARHRVELTPDRARDYARVRTLFELTRDGGPWRLRWAITDRDPTARFVWDAWRTRPPAVLATAASATAECDEISALFAGLARRLGVRGVGLFWPTSNHTIAAWELAPGQRIMIPTTQIFQACDATFDETTFSPTKQKTVFEFPAADVPDTFTMPRALASFLLAQVAQYAGASLDVLAVVRLHRALRLGSSVPGTCTGHVTAEARRLRGAALSQGDRRALAHYGAAELGLAGASAEDVLERVSSAGR